MITKAAFVLGLICAVSPAMGQINSGAVGVAGHVYNLDDGQPLAGVVVTVESSQNNQDDQRRVTSKDGGYAFDHLEPGGYTITAFRSGFIGEIYGMTPAGSVSTLELRPGQSRDNIDFHLRTSPPITEMPNEAMAAAYPENLSDLGAVYGRFSPDGNLLAIVTNGIVIGDPEQVWLYNLGTKNLFAVTETPVPKVSPAILAIAWVGNTLYVEGDRTQTSRDFVVKATANGAEEIAALPPEAQKNQTAPGVDYDDTVGSYRVWVEKPCHGCGFDLNARALNASKQFTIASDMSGIGSATFVLDPPAPIVFYPVISWNGAIIAFNLETRRSARLDLPIHRFSNLLAAKKEENDFLIAYAVDSGSCTPMLSPYGEDIWLLPNNAELRRQKHSMSICFVLMHAGE
jgi:hypothetical protein